MVVSLRSAGISRVSMVVLGFGFVGSRVSSLQASIYECRGAKAAAITTMEG